MAKPLEFELRNYVQPSINLSTTVSTSTTSTVDAGETPFLACILQLSPAPGAVVGNDLFEHSEEGRFVKCFTLANGDGTCGVLATYIILAEPNFNTDK